MHSFLTPNTIQRPEYYVGYTWHKLIPIAFWLVEATRPRRFVELGTYTGTSYNGFCQAVVNLGLDTKCYAVDTWKGDANAGYYPEQVYKDLQTWQQGKYSDFSTLIRSTFDEALGQFEDGSIDLLHIDGLHHYEAVCHDFSTWKPKLSDRAVVLFHDTNVREIGYGVHHLWKELSQNYPHFEFMHSNGLGILGVGASLPDGIKPLFETSNSPEKSNGVRQIFETLGENVRDAYELQELKNNPYKASVKKLVGRL